MQEVLNSLLEYGYVILFFYSLGGGMVALIAAGVLSAGGKLDITTSIAVAAVANALGDALLFYFARNNKPAILPYLRGQRRKLAYCQLLLRRRGDIVVLIQKFIYGVKTLIPIVIALTHYSAFKFNVLNAISAVIWALTIGICSYVAGDVISEAVGDSGYAGAVLAILVLAGGYYLLGRASARRAR